MATRIQNFEINPRLARILVWTLILSYIALFSWLSVTRHQALRTDAYDMGNVNQALWNTVHGRPLYFTNWRGVELSLATDSRLAMHVEPIYFLIAPLYWLWQTPETVLVLQTVILALGAWPVFWLARDALHSNLSGVAFAAIYLLFPGLQAANLWEFHAVALAAPLLLYAFYFGWTGRWGLLWLFAILAMATKEEIPLTVFLMGLYFVVTGLRQRRQQVVSQETPATSQLPFLQRPGGRPMANGLALSLVAAIWFVLAVFVVIPHFEGQGSPYLSYFTHLGDPGPYASAGALPNPLSAAGTLFGQRNLGYLVDLYTPVAFTSLLNPLTMAFSLPDLTINLLSDHEPMHFVQKYHYTAPLLPGVMISAVLGSAWLASRLARVPGVSRSGAVLLLTLLVLVASGYYHYYHGYTPLARAFEPYQVTPHHQLGAAIGQEIPAEASVSAQRYLNPQVSGRQTLYRFPYVEDAEYVFLDLATLNNEGGGLFGVARKLLEGDEFGPVRAEDGYLLLQRGAQPDPNLSDQFFGFARMAPDQVEPQYPVDIVFGDKLRLVGFDLYAGRRTEMPQTPLRFDLYWQPLSELEEDYHIGLYLLNENGEAIGGPDFNWEPGLEYWYPTSRWPQDEIVVTRMRNMPWWTEQYDRYSVAVGVLTERKPWEVGARLRPQVVYGDLRLPYADNGTLVTLMEFVTDPGGMPVSLEPRQLLEAPRGIQSYRATWRNGIELLGYDLDPARARPGDDLSLTLYWRTGQPLATDFTVFVHLVDDEGKLVAQHDGQPHLGGLPTTRWQPGQVIPDRHGLQLPASTSTDDLDFLVGFYDQATGQRESLLDGTDAIRLPLAP